LATGMEGKLAELRKGRTKVIETNHTSREIWIWISFISSLCLILQLYSIGHQKSLISVA
jgi:hypothetical protein